MNITITGISLIVLETYQHIIITIIIFIAITIIVINIDFKSYR